MYSKNNNIFIIAEAGVNHNGDLNLAKKLIQQAAKAGANAVKFQTFRAENVASKYSEKAAYQKQTTCSSESQLEMLRELELDIDDHQILLSHCLDQKIQFLSTPFDVDSIHLLNDLGLDIYKIPSGEITNVPYLREIGALKKKIIISTGMAELDEIKDALNLLENCGTKRGNITVLHCNTEYPTPMKDVNLRAMITIQNSFPEISVGYSDHTLGIEVPIAAAALGAIVIEKHFTLDRTMKGPDHKASLEPEELQRMVKAIRNIEQAMGSGIKKPSLSELKNKTIVRKSIVASKNITKGERFSEENLTTKRPGTGISPALWDEIIGSKAIYNFQKNELIKR